jgi:hypothetical protein
MATLMMATTTMASTTANKGTIICMENQRRLILTLQYCITTSLEASPSSPQTRICLERICLDVKGRAAVSSSVNTSAPLELSTVLAQSHPQQSVLCWPASPRHSLAWGHCSSASSSLALAPQVLHSYASAHVSPSLQCLPLPQADYSCSSDRAFPCFWLLGQNLLQHALLVLPQGPHSS